MADFTPTQGRYLSFIQAYTDLHGYPPAESEIAAAMCVSGPSVNQMVKTLERQGLIERQPGKPRTIRILVHEDEIPPWNQRSLRTVAPPGKSAALTPRTRPSKTTSDINLYVLSVYLIEGPINKSFGRKQIRRDLEIQGTQTLGDLHEAIFSAFERYDPHLYEFQFGKRAYDPDGPNYGPPELVAEDENCEDAETITLDDLDLTPRRAFGYLFDLGDQWLHQIDVIRVEKAISTVQYPRIIKRVGTAPPQYPLEDE
jgi:Plasmid pRiA4b ORF-3-like protein/LexA DNA binding domain